MSSRPLPRCTTRPRRARTVLVVAVTALCASTCLGVAVLVGRQLAQAGTRSSGLPDVLVAAVELALALGAGAWLARTSVDVWSLSRGIARSGAELGPPSQLALPTGRARIAALLLGVSLGATALPAQASPRSPTSAVASTAAIPAAAAATPSDASRVRPTAAWASSPDSRQGDRAGDRAGAPSGPVSPELRPPAPPGPAPVDPELRPARQVQPGRLAPTATHVVVRGDTLWRIAARHLPPDADAETVARACAAWHDRNRDTIGPDRDLILPGQVLTAPVPAPTVNQLQGNP